MAPPKNQANSDKKKNFKEKKSKEVGGTMYGWAQNEMKFLPQGRHANKKLPNVETFQKLCQGKGLEYWEYIINHVKSAETVKKVKMNLALSSPAGGENEEVARIQRYHKLVTERDKLRDRVIKQRSDMEKVMTELKKSENDLNRTEINNQSRLGKIEEINKQKMLLSTFSMKCGQDKKKVQDYQSRITDQLNKYQQLVSKLNETTQFYSRPKSYSSHDSGLESACTKDVREACETIANYLSEKPGYRKQMTQQQESISEKISNVMVSYPANRIIASLIEVTNEVALDIQMQMHAIDVSDDVKKLKFKQEASGELTDLSTQPSIQQSVDQLIERSQLEHILRFVAIQKHKNSIFNLEEQLSMTKDKCHHSLQQNLGGLPDMLNLTEMVLNAEIKLSGSQAGLKCLQKLDSELTQRHARIETEKATLQQKFQRIQDFGKVTDGKQNLIKALVRQTRSTPKRLLQQREEILAYINHSLKPCRNEVTKLVAELSGNVVNEMKIFSTISLAHLPYLMVPKLGMISRHEFDINKFRPEIVDPQEELLLALENLEFPYHRAPEFLLPACVEFQNGLRAYQRQSQAREVTDCGRTTTKMGEILAKVDRHDQVVKERVIPKMEHCLQKTSEELAQCIQLLNLVDVWWEQPGQYTTPWVVVDGKTFQDYKDEWTILCTKLRQLQRNQ